jgi:DNA-binding protein H-NS
MRHSDLETLTVDELWDLHEEIAATLALRLTSEKNVLEERLRQLNQQNHLAEGKTGTTDVFRRRRPVTPKYQNPDQPADTWSGRGKKPRWLTKLITSGRHIEDFLIET